MKIIDEKKIYLDKKDLIRVLDDNGDLIDKKYKPSISENKLKEAYEYMVLSRQQDNYMSQLQRSGYMLTFAPNFGEEALQVACSSVMEKDDWFVPAFRSNATMLHLGVPIKNQLLYWNGSEKGSNIPKDVNVLPINITIGAQFSHAAGIAYGMKLNKKKNISITFIGNGGTAEGEFYEAMNISKIHDWPVVFCINNNKWAISTPNELESGSKTLAAKAVAAGLPSVRVDGNDLLASYDVMKEVANFTRSGKGPVLVEFITWREGAHTTSDNPRIYRTEEEEKEKEKWEPFHRIEKYIIDNKIMSASEIKKLKEDKLNEVKKVYQESLKDLNASIDDVFDHTYDKLTPELEEQKNEAIAYYKEEK